MNRTGVTPTRRRSIPMVSEHMQPVSAKTVTSIICVTGRAAAVTEMTDMSDPPYQLPRPRARETIEEFMSDTRRIDSITIGPRFRKDFAGVEALAASIAAVGLLQPPGVTPDGRLLWGECRLRACRSFGWTEIPVIVRDVDPADFVAIEAAENFARKDFTLSEAVAIKRAIEPQLRAEAEARQKTGRPSANFAGGATGSTVFYRIFAMNAAQGRGHRRGGRGRAGALRQAGCQHGQARQGRGSIPPAVEFRQGEQIRAEPPPLPAGPFMSRRSTRRGPMNTAWRILRTAA